VRRASTRSSGAGWNADYPDAENFLFLLYGPNAKSKCIGRREHGQLRRMPEYDRLFAPD
jgi:ABC-type oligopeptide transport system substrate-binding subunit